MNLSLKVQCTHPEKGNIDADLIEILDAHLGGVFRCQECQREIVVYVEEGAE